MKLNKKNLALLVLLRVVLVLILCYCSLFYYELNHISKTEKPIEYSIKSAERISGGKNRRSYGLIRIEYNEKDYKVEIQLEEYYKYVNKNKKPALYYSQKRDIVFAQRRINQFRAWAIISGIILLVSCIPFDRISKKMDEDIKKKELHRMNSSRE
jgi:hypothetical protein